MNATRTNTNTNTNTNARRTALPTLDKLTHHSRRQAVVAVVVFVVALAGSIANADAWQLQHHHQKFSSYGTDRIRSTTTATRRRSLLPCPPTSSSLSLLPPARGLGQPGFGRRMLGTRGNSGNWNRNENENPRCRKTAINTINTNHNTNDGDGDGGKDSNPLRNGRLSGFRNRAGGWVRALFHRKRTVLPLLLLLFSAALAWFPAGASAAAGASALPDAAALASSSTLVASAATPATVVAPITTTATTTTAIVCPVSAEVELRLTLRLVYAALTGAALGKERSFAKHSAGVRTMSLVSMGAAIFTVCSCYGFSGFAKVDASRMAASVASGVGFVGAGVITTSMHNTNNNNNRGQDASSTKNPRPNNVVHGLTTAATIWLSAAVGVSCGVGLLRVATTAAAATIFILRMGRKRHRTEPSATGKGTNVKANAKANGTQHEFERQRQHQRHPEPRQQQQQQQHDDSRNHRKIATSESSHKHKHNDNDNDNDNDDGEDYYHAAEIHVTDHWDEHHHEDPIGEDGRSLSFFNANSSSSKTIQTKASSSSSSSSPPPAAQDRDPARHNSEIGTNPDQDQYRDQYRDAGRFLVGEENILGDDPSRLMEEIVRSAWKNDNATVTALVDLVLDRYEHREGQRPFSNRPKRACNGTDDSGYFP